MTLKELCGRERCSLSRFLLRWSAARLRKVVKLAEAISQVVMLAFFFLEMGFWMAMVVIGLRQRWYENPSVKSDIWSNGMFWGGFVFLSGWLWSDYYVWSISRCEWAAVVCGVSEVCQVLFRYTCTMVLVYRVLLVIVCLLNVLLNGRASLWRDSPKPNPSPTQCHVCSGVGDRRTCLNKGLLVHTSRHAYAHAHTYIA